MEQLKPCPFCGAPPRPEATWREGTNLYTCPTPGCPGYEIGGDYGGHEAADWNRRTPDLTEALAKLKALEERMRSGWLSYVDDLSRCDEIAAIRKVMGGD